MSDNIRKGCHNLLFRCEFGTLLEFEVPNGSGEGKVAIHTSEVDKPSGSIDTRLLPYSKCKSKGISKVYPN